MQAQDLAADEVKAFLKLITGSMRIDITKEPIAQDKKGNDVFLRDIWPTAAEIAEIQRKSVTPSMFAKRYKDVFKGDKHWQGIKVTGGQTYAWDDSSTYVANPPYFEGMTKEPEAVAPIDGARVLVEGRGVVPGEEPGTWQDIDGAHFAFVSNASPWTFLNNRAVFTNPGTDYGTGLGVFASRSMRTIPNLVLVRQMLSARRTKGPTVRHLVRHDDLD